MSAAPQPTAYFRASPHRQTLCRITSYNVCYTKLLRADASANFDQVTAAAGLKIVANTPAFSATDSVKGVDPTAPFARAAFGLQKDETHYYSDPVRNNFV